MSKTQLTEVTACEKIKSIYEEWQESLLNIINNNQDVREDYKASSRKESEEYSILLRNTDNAINRLLNQPRTFDSITSLSDINSLLRIILPMMTNEFTLHLLVKFVASDFFESRADVPDLIRTIIFHNTFVQSNLNKYDPVTESNIADLLLPIIATNIYNGNISANLHILNTALDTSLNLDKEFRGNTTLTSLAMQNLYQEVVKLLEKKPNLKIDPDLPRKVISNFHQYPTPFYREDYQTREAIYINGNNMTPIGVSIEEIQSKYNGKIHLFLDDEGKTLGIECAVKIIKTLYDYGLKINSNILIESNNIGWNFPVNEVQTVYSNRWMNEQIMSIEGFDPNSKNNHGNPLLFSILQQSALNKDFSLAYKLINHEKFDAKVLSESGHSAIHAVFAIIDDLEVAKQLIKILILKDIELNKAVGSQTLFNYMVTKINQNQDDTIKNKMYKIAAHLTSLAEFNPNLTSTGIVEDQPVSISDIVLAIQIANENILESFIKNTKFNSFDPLDSSGYLITNAIIASLPKDPAKKLLEILVTVKGYDIINQISSIYEDNVTLFNFIVSQMQKSEDHRKAELLEIISYIVSVNDFNPNLFSIGKTQDGEKAYISDILLALQMGNEDIINKFINSPNLDLSFSVDFHGSFITHAIIMFLPEELAKNYITILLNKNPDIINIKTQNAESHTPFLCAITSQKSTNFLDFLKEYGADLHIKQLSGVSATHIAAHLGRKDIIFWLHENGAFTFEHISLFNKANPSDVAYNAAHKDLAEDIKYLAFLDAATSAKNEDRKTFDELKKEYGIDANYIPNDAYLKNIALSLNISIPNVNIPEDTLNLDSLSLNPNEYNEVKISGDTDGSNHDHI